MRNEKSVRGPRGSSKIYVDEHVALPTPERTIGLRAGSLNHIRGNDISTSAAIRHYLNFKN